MAATRVQARNSEEGDTHPKDLAGPRVERQPLSHTGMLSILAQVLISARSIT